MEIRERIEKYGIKSIITNEALSLLLKIPVEILKDVNISYLFENYNNKDRFILTKTQKTKIKTLKKIISEFTQEDDNTMEKITGANAVSNIMIPKFGKKETSFVMTLNTKNVIIDITEMGEIGQVDVKEIYKIAILDSANAIIVAHNHSNENTRPSNEEINWTKEIRKKGEAVGIALLDYLIIGGNRYLSFKEEKMI